MALIETNGSVRSAEVDPNRVLLLDVNWTNNSKTIAPRGGAAAPARDAEMRLIMQHGSSDVGPSELMAVADAIDTRRGAAVLR